MMSDPEQDTREQAFVARVSGALEQSAQDLDALTLARLGGARRRALAARRRPLRAALPAGLATAAAAVLVAVLWTGAQSPQAPGVLVDDLELLAGADDLELYEDLEFYQWLEASDELAG